MIDRGFGERVRAARQAAGMSQEALAARADLSRTQLQNIEAGRFGTGLATAIRLAAALAVPLEVLAYGPPTMEAVARHPRAAVYLAAIDQARRRLVVLFRGEAEVSP